SGIVESHLRAIFLSAAVMNMVVDLQNQSRAIRKAPARAFGLKVRGFSGHPPTNCRLGELDVVGTIEAGGRILIVEGLRFPFLIHINECVVDNTAGTRFDIDSR